MEANEKTFRHSFGKVALMFLSVLFFGFLAFINQIDYFLLAITGIVLVIVLLYATSSVKISSDEITTSRLLGSKSLRWSDIARVSTRGQALRLHNYDEDVILSVDSQLEGYKEILDILFSKRPDLFDEHENAGMLNNWLVSVFFIGLGLLFIAASVFLFSMSPEPEKFFFLVLFALGILIIVTWFLSPKSLTLESNNLILGYLFKEVSYSADDINSIDLERKSSRNGYIYFVRINLRSGKKVRPPLFKGGSALTYQILKRWHQKASQ
jgi:hypothetical protein